MLFDETLADGDARDGTSDRGVPDQDIRVPFVAAAHGSEKTERPR